MADRIPALRGLYAFDAAARLGSFSRAADELSRTQSAVSQQVSKLEAELGQKLFLRRGSGVVLTAAGELLHQTVRETFDRLEAGLARIEPYPNRNAVLLACPDDFAHGWLVPRMAAFRDSFPGIELWMMVQDAPREIDRVDVDLIVSRRPIHTADVECVAMLEDANVAVCGPRTLERLRDAPWPRLLERAPLLHLERDPGWAARLAPRASRARWTRGATIDDPRLLLDAVEQDLGIAYVSRVLAERALGARRIHLLPQVPRESRPRLWLMRSRLPARTPRADEAYAWLRGQAAGRLPGADARAAEMS